MSQAGIPTNESVTAALLDVRRRIASAAPDPDRVRIVAVTKGHGPQAVRAALEAGVPDIGENYAQELSAKAAVLEEQGIVVPRWHFLGAIQRNKVRTLSSRVGLWQSVDRIEEAESIGAAAPGAEVMVEVALASGPDRSGCAPADAAGLVDAIRDRGAVSVVGLMAVGPPGLPERSPEGFRWLAAEALRLGLEQVSMGMTADLEEAVSAGSTMVRLGTALFGPRPGAPGLGR